MSKNDRTGEKWSREETILAFDLYCRMPFGKIHHSNPNVIELAQLLGRTPGSVSLKMQNLAHFDPELQQRNVSAMNHASKLDREISEEFSNDWENLSYQAQKIRARMLNQSLSEIVNLEDIEEIPAGEYRERMTKTRVGQYFFRMTVLNSYGNRCCVTGIDQPELIVASHIKPWRVSDEKTERTNPHNGLCLNALHDKAFDRGFVTISQDYKLIISSKIRETKMDSDTKTWFMKYDNREINLPKKFLPGRDFIEYHNDAVFLR